MWQLDSHARRRPFRSNRLIGMFSHYIEKKCRRYLSSRFVLVHPQTMKSRRGTGEPIAHDRDRRSGPPKARPFSGSAEGTHATRNIGSDWAVTQSARRRAGREPVEPVRLAHGPVVPSVTGSHCLLACAVARASCHAMSRFQQISCGTWGRGGSGHFPSFPRLFRKEWKAANTPATAPTTVKIAKDTIQQ
jgi:hypothetical protein